MANEVVNIQYIKNIVSGKVIVQDSLGNNYCPNKTNLIDGSICPYFDGTNTGVEITNENLYSINQLVLERDLEFKKPITPSSITINTMTNSSNVKDIHEVVFYFNNNNMIQLREGSMQFGDTRHGFINNYEPDKTILITDFPIKLTSYEYETDTSAGYKTTGLVYTINYPVYSYQNYLDDEIMVISISDSL